MNSLKHFPHYFSLISLLMAGFVGVYAFSYDQGFQIGILMAMSLSYISWGIIHHAIHKDICLSIIFEYIAVAILGGLAVFFLILRS